jgi:hypothetical protein
MRHRAAQIVLATAPAASNLRAPPPLSGVAARTALVLA